MGSPLLDQMMGQSMQTPQQWSGYGLNTNQGLNKGGQNFAPTQAVDYVAQSNLQGQKGVNDYYYSKDLARQGFGFQTALQGQQNKAETERAQIAAQASELPSLLKDQHFNQLLPMLSGQLGAGGKQFPFPESPAGPEVTVQPVLNAQQVQQQVNQSNAQTDAQASNQQSQNGAQMAGRGFGANSPLLAMLNTATQNSAAGQKSANETNLRLGAARDNAQQVLNSQQARAQEFEAQQQQESSRFGSSIQRQNSILAALAGLI